MGYDRTYSREEIHQILCLSERRLRPTSPAAHAYSGHAISRHTEQREDPFDRREIMNDGTFASRKDLILAVEDALHHPIGQRELATLNNNASRCTIAVQLSATLGKIKANVVTSPGSVGRGAARVLREGPQRYLALVPVNSVIVVVDKCGLAESWAPLHIQTAYPKDIAI
jgi:hypothetical protein